MRTTSGTWWKATAAAVVMATAGLVTAAPPPAHAASLNLVFTGSCRNCTSLAVAGNGVLAIQGTQTLRGWPSSGPPPWSRTLTDAQTIRNIVVEGSRALVTVQLPSGAEQLRAFDAATGTPGWTLTPPTPVTGKPSAIYDVAVRDGAIYVLNAAADGAGHQFLRVTRVNDDGTVVWSALQSNEWAGSVAVSRGVVYTFATAFGVPLQTDSLTEYSATTGALLHRFTYSDPVSTPFRNAVADGNRVYAVQWAMGIGGYGTVAFDTTTGEMAFNGAGTSRAAVRRGVLVDAGWHISSSGNNTLVAYDAVHGTPLWGPIATVGNGDGPAVSDSAVFTTLAHTVEMRQLTTGALTGQLDVPDGATARRPVVKASRVYVLTDTHVYGIAF